MRPEDDRAANPPPAEFLLGQIEAIPLPDGSVDVIISNCVINLSTERSAVFAESFRVLRPGGLPRAAGFRVVGTRERIGLHHGRWRDTVLIERRSRVV